MRFLEAVVTQEGEGVVVARTAEGGLLVAMAAREVVLVTEEKGKPVVKRYPGANLIMQRCEEHGVWFNVLCAKCQVPDDECQGGNIDDDDQ